MKAKRLVFVAAILAVVCWQREIAAMNNAFIRLFNANSNRYEEVPVVEKTDEEWRKILTPEQFNILRRHGTERAFTHNSSHIHRGVYKCIGCGADLFSSEHKFESGTGWPSFWKPIASENIGTQTDHTLLVERTEVHCARCKGHLGHIFDDGPPPTGKRYCINGTVLKFVETK